MAIIKPNNNTLSSITALPTGLGGKVLQVVTSTDDTVRTTTSTSFVTGTLAVSITPSSSSNKVFVVTSGTCHYNQSNKRFRATIYRGSTNLDGDGSNGLIQGFAGSSTILSSIGMTILDSPNTTSSTTYTVYFRADDSGGGTAYLGEYNVRKCITAYEIAG